jgi:hypothetical protein
MPNPLILCCRNTLHTMACKSLVLVVLCAAAVVLAAEARELMVDRTVSNCKEYGALAGCCLSWSYVGSILLSPVCDRTTGATAAHQSIQHLTDKLVPLLSFCLAAGVVNKERVSGTAMTVNSRG